MKPFNLEKALAGEPVVLRNGDKAFVKFVLENPVREECAMIGYVIDDRGRDSLIGWYKNGLYASCGGDGLDIIGMYEEPRPTVTLTLPCPLKSVTVGQRVFYLDLNKQCERICAFLFQKDSTYHFNLLKNGGIFSTEEDAQAWLDAMKNARR
ncbi:pyruvate kinase [Pasteurella multocida]|uniref:pyruvate kinase n=2 Tax=Pasteurella multocida TaxID=747 RepID=UPI0007EDACF8|nr:pyruvate kinase [Pasteurella multocida]MCL7822657.1 pyruvate kinase [Pasteurella multocida]MDY0577159.1 pyruvate kinase [Pasteurella multocida]MEB3481315.1 pyruvate kinase [Pasteurella multocida]OBP35863.1 pyruvate kinase [Pasteurella multocida subsp. multocida]URH97382.1 pyruvate kinase [Pasteurella multocida]